MTCETIRLAEGFAIVCTRGPKKKAVCVICQKPGADRLCDGQQDLKRTCDRPLHRACAARQGDADFCLWHAPLNATELEQKLVEARPVLTSAQETVDPPEGWGP